MRKFIIILIALIPLMLCGKETKKITIEYFNQSVREIYFVLKSDTTVRHGSYKVLSNGKILVDGYYKMGLMDSLWLRYNQKGQLRVRGFYSENKRVGIWEFNDDKGETEQKVDFTNGQIMLYRSQLIGNTFKVYSGSDSVFALLDRPPLYLGGTSRMKEHISSEIVAPLHKANEKVLGTVFVEFIVDSTGKTSNHRILKGISPRCNAEALRVVRSLPDEWFPGILNNRSITSSYVIPVVFDDNLFKNNPSLVNSIHY
jgi:periplasmic protein TonB